MAVHPPASPALLERTAVHGREAIGVRVLVLQRIDALHHQPWHAERVPGQVTRKTVVAALEERLRSGILRDLIEDDALSRILRGDFDDLRAADVADGDG